MQPNEVGQQYLVGGAVRDRLLGYPWSERDWVVVGATPEQMLDAGFKPVGKDFPVFLHPETNEEYALARTERKSGRGYHGFICHSSPDVTLEEDLARRDLTINAIAEDAHGALVDPYGGCNDLERRILRHVSPAFGEDPLRILRVARFAARYHHLGFHVAAETQALMAAMVDEGEADALVAERVWKETERALGGPNPEVYFATLRQCGALRVLFPELLDAQRGLADLERCAAATPSPLLRFAVLCTRLPADTVTTLCTRGKIPNEYRELAVLAAQQIAAIAGADDPARAFAILEASDALRRPERFAQLLEVGAQLQLPGASLRRLRAAQAALSTVDTQVLIARGFSGKTLGEELRRERMRAITESWR
jgi:tRNA nucleotidyltransferase (CCA-adding enzyme)